MAPKVPLILVADDVASVRLLSTTVLIAEGYRVIEARDGVEALERVRDDNPDLLITDISMPRMDGIRVLEALRKSGNRIPVIVITAHKDRDTVLEAAHKGIVSYLTKPINLKDFRDRVRKILIEQGVLKAGDRPQTGPSLADAALDPGIQRWLDSVPTEGWNLSRLQEFLRMGEDLSAEVTSIALAADSATPREPTLAERLSQDPVPVAVHKLQVAFERGDGQVKLAAIDLLPPALSEEQRVQVLQRWAATPDLHLQVRTRIVDAVGSTKGLPAVQALLSMMDGAPQEIRSRILEAIAACGWLKALEPLIACCAATGKDFDEDVYDRIRSLPAQHVVEKFRGILRVAGSEVRSGVIHLALRLGWPESRRMVENALSDPEADVRCAAIQGLSQSRDKRVAGMLLELVTDPEPAVLQALSRAIVNAALRIDTRRIVQRACAMDAEFRAAMPEFLASLESTEQALQAVLLARLREDEASRAALVRMARALGSQEILPTGPIGPVVAGAFADHLAELLVKPPAEGSR